MTESKRRGRGRGLSRGRARQTKRQRRIHQRRTRIRRRQRGGFTPYPSTEFGPNMIESEEAGGAVVIRNVSGVPTPMSASKYMKEYRGEYDDEITG